MKPGDNTSESGLPAPRLSDDTEDFTGADGQRDVIKRLGGPPLPERAAGEVFNGVFHFQQRRGVSHVL